MKKTVDRKKILVVGTPERQAEFAKLSIGNAELDFAEEFDFGAFGEMMEFEDEFPDYELDLPDLSEYEVIFDLNLDDYPENLSLYIEYPDLVIVGCSVKLSLAMMLAEYGEEFANPIFGMNALPTFIDRPVVELCLRNGRDFDELADLMDDLGLKYEIVEDRIGMVTPRVVCMIINEAAFTYGEGTAGVEEIDQAMKLGTNYPQGPFKWADMIGLHNVVAVVSGLHIDSGDGKYKVAPALKAAMLNNTRFYS